MARYTSFMEQLSSSYVPFLADLKNRIRHGYARKTIERGWGPAILEAEFGKRLREQA